VTARTERTWVPRALALSLLLLGTASGFAFALAVLGSIFSHAQD
jgi:hypothetical protein